MITAKQRIKSYVNEHGSFPDINLWKLWGYSEKYYYQVKRELKKEGFI